MTRSRDASRLIPDGRDLLPFTIGQDAEPGSMGAALEDVAFRPLDIAQAAINKAAVPVSTSEFYGAQFKPTNFAAGFLVTTGLTVNRAQQISGISHGTAFTLQAASNQSLFTVNPSPDTDPLVQSDISHPEISGFMLNGFASEQSATSHGINFPNTTWSMATRYSVSARVSDIIINNFRDDNILVGINRNFGFFEKVISRYAGQNSLQLQSYDNRVLNSEFGNSVAGAGILMSVGGGNFLSHVSSYLNATYGTVIGPFVNQTNSDIGGCQDSNYQGGYYIDSGGQHHAPNAIVGKRFQGNSKGGSGVFPDIDIRNSPTPHVIAGNLFAKGGTTQPNYLVLLGADTDFAHFVGNAFSQAPGQLPWQTAISNRPYNLILAGSQKARISFPTGDADSLGVFMGATETVRFDPTQMSIKQPLAVRLSASVAPSVNSDMMFELTSNTQLTIRVRGSDGTTRSVALTLA